MKTLKYLTVAALTASFLAAPIASLAADQPEAAAPKPKPYTLKTCVVSDETLGEMGKPFVFTYKDREIKLCCKNCKKDFDKEPEKYIKKIEAAEKEAAAKDAKK